MARLSTLCFVLTLLAVTLPASADTLYGPTEPGDSLWSIAARLRTAESPSTAELVRQLHANNPNAFIGGDIDRLRVGVVLSLPGPAPKPADEIREEPTRAPIIERPAPATIRDEPVLEAPTTPERIDAPAERPLDIAEPPAAVAPPIPPAATDAEPAARVSEPEPASMIAPPTGETVETAPPDLTAPEEPDALPAAVEPPESGIGDRPAVEDAIEQELTPAPGADLEPSAEGLIGAPSMPSTDTLVPAETLAPADPPVMSTGPDETATIEVEAPNQSEADLQSPPTPSAVEPDSRPQPAMPPEMPAEPVAAPQTPAEPVQPRIPAEPVATPMPTEPTAETAAPAEAMDDQAPVQETESMPAAAAGGEIRDAATAESTEPVGLPLATLVVWGAVGLGVLILLGTVLVLMRSHRPEEDESPADPESVDELVVRAEQEAAAGNYNLARSALRRAIGMRPADTELWLKLVEIEYRQGDTESFAADAEELKALFDEFGNQERWGTVEAMGQELSPHLPPFCPPEEAVARRATPADERLSHEYTVAELVERAEQEASEGNYNLARSALRQAIAQDPDHHWLKLRLLEIEFDQGDAESYAADAQDFQMALMESDWSRVKAMGKRLCPHLPPFAPPEETAARSEAADESPLTPEYTIDELLERAERESAEGNLNLARSALRQALAIEPAALEARMRLLRIEYAQRDRGSFAEDIDETAALIEDREGPIWEELASMYRDLFPERTPLGSDEDPSAGEDPWKTVG